MIKFVLSIMYERNTICLCACTMEHFVWQVIPFSVDLKLNKIYHHYHLKKPDLIAVTFCMHIQKYPSYLGMCMQNFIVIRLIWKKT